MEPNTNTGTPVKLSSVFESLDYNSVRAAIIGILKTEEKYLLGLRERLHRNNRSARSIDNKDVARSKHRMDGIIDAAISIGIDCTEFQWIYDL